MLSKPKKQEENQQYDKYQRPLSVEAISPRNFNEMKLSSRSALFSLIAREPKVNLTRWTVRPKAKVGENLVVHCWDFNSEFFSASFGWLDVFHLNMLYI